MRKRRLLLAATALSAACGRGKGEERQPLPGNPKGSVYDAQALEPQPLPGNPKGTFYDAAVPPPQPPDAAAVDAAGAPRDAPRVFGNPKGPNYEPIKPRDAGVDARPAPADAAIRPLPGNPKGSFYDAGVRKTPIDD